MKGQFFIIGALLVCVLLFFGMTPDINITRTRVADIDRLAENLETEMPHALNLGINSSKELETLYNFTIFSVNAAKSRMINMPCYWLVFQPDGGDVNVTVGNFMGSGKNFRIQIFGSEKTLYVDHNSTNSSLFSVPGYKFDVEVYVDDELVKEAELLTNKTSIYSSMSLERGGNVIRKEILA